LELGSNKKKNRPGKSQTKAQTQKRTNPNKSWRRKKLNPNMAQNLNKLLTDIESTKAKLARKEQLMKDMAFLSQGLGSMSLHEEDITIV
jgi:hypothetical protein